MIFLFNLLKINFAKLFLLANQGGVSFGHYDIAKSLTIPGWIIIIMFPLALILGIIYLTIKIFKKPKLK